jgi:transcriptional regulator with XRE-family HTH domain
MTSQNVIWSLIMQSTPNTYTALRRHRLAKGLTQPQLAKLIGCSQAVVSYWETGRGFPRDPKHQRELHKLFPDVPIWALFVPEPTTKED